MTEISKLIEQWKESDSQNKTWKDLFTGILHKEPYHLRYSLSSDYPDLFMIHTTEKSKIENPVVQECNGIILQKEDYQICSYGMRTLQRITAKRGRCYLTEEFFQKIDSIEEAEDGTVLRVWYHHNTESWVVSTNRRINAYRVTWGSPKSFGLMLEDVFNMMGVSRKETFDNDLDKEWTYSFVLLHPENQHVLFYPFPKLVYISKRHNSSFEETEADSGFSWCSLPTLLPKEKTSREDLLSRLGSYLRMQKRGLIFTDRSDPTTVHRTIIDYPWFENATELRKNLPYIHLSYLACNDEEKTRLRYCFGNQPVFDALDGGLRYLVTYALNSYHDAYVKKRYRISKNHPIGTLMKILHHQYKITGKSIKTAHVKNSLDNLPYYVLDNILLYCSRTGWSEPSEENHDWNEKVGDVPVLEHGSVTILKRDDSEKIEGEVIMPITTQGEEESAE